ncbi:MAG: c-type cytochrome, partial [Pseudomonadales bacterium]|nr:c-type cytochrome [Pseudomonadales bacterium]
FPFLYSLDAEFKATGLYKRNPGTFNLGLDLKNSTFLATEYADEALTAKGYLKAFDPLTGEELWNVDHVHYWNSGVVATAGGLVFQGDGLGYLSAYNTDNGEKLWTYNTYISMLAPPITYEIDGEQYVVILAGTGGPENFVGYTNDTAAYKYGNFGKLLGFKLDSKVVLEAPDVLDKTLPEQPELVASADELFRGEQLYNGVCGICHGGAAKSAGIISDLRMMNSETHKIFKNIVLDGAYAGKGMASFADILNEKDTETIRQYIISRGIADKAEAEALESSAGGS